MNFFYLIKEFLLRALNSEDNRDLCLEVRHLAEVQTEVARMSAQQNQILDRIARALERRESRPLPAQPAPIVFPPGQPVPMPGTATPEGPPWYAPTPNEPFRKGPTCASA